MANYITRDWLNLRSRPELNPDNIILTLTPDTVVEKLDSGQYGDWFNVRTIQSGHDVDGFVFSQYVMQTNQTLLDQSVILKNLPTVNMPVPEDRIVSRKDTNWRAYPLNEDGLNIVNLKSLAGPAERSAAIFRELDWLDVEKSARYLPDAENTFCNIYVYDVAYCMGAFLPRVWWTASAIYQLQMGQTPGIIYGKTVTELNANSLEDWFENYGSMFGWKRQFNYTSLQNVVNGGTIGVIVGQRVNLNNAGHIVIVVPESSAHNAARDKNLVLSPLQSQAGSYNHKYYSGSNWWENQQRFRKFSMWVFDSA